MFQRTWLKRSAAAAINVVTAPQFVSFESGAEGTREWRLFLRDPSTHKTLSAWHDLHLHPVVKPVPASSSASPSAAAAAAAAPLTAAVAAGDPRLFAAITEIPRGTRAKMELCKEEAHNPIKQDVFKKEEGQPLRFFRYGDMPFNYGFLPRTWEDPSHKDHRTGCIGDGDPIDVVHLGKPHVLGQYDVVRVLGVLGLIDQGETDWKIIVESALPEAGGGYGSLSKVPQDIQATIIDWFENYKVPDGKPKNEFAFNKEIRGEETALEIIAQCAQQYDALMTGKYPDLGYWLR